MFQFKESNVINVPVEPCFDFMPRLQPIKGQDGSRWVLFTEAIESVSIYDVDSGKSDKNWTFQSSSPLSCPVMYNETSQNFVAVTNKKEMRVFEYQDNDLNDVRILKFRRPILCLLHDQDRDVASDLIVLYDSGHMSFLTEAIQDRRTVVEGEEEQLISGRPTQIKILNLRKEFFDLEIVSKDDSDKSWFTILSMNRETQITSVSKKVKIPQKFTISSIDSSGLIGGIAPNGNIGFVNPRADKVAFEVKQTIEDDLEDLLAFVVLGNNVVGVLKVSKERTVFSIINLKYNLTEEILFEKVLKVTSVDVNTSTNKIYFVTDNSIIMKSYDLKPTTLEMVLKYKNKKSESSSENILASSSPEKVSNSSTSELNSLLKKNLDEAKSIPEILLTTSLKNVLENDPNLESQDTKEFFDVIVKSPFNEKKMLDNLRTSDIKCDELFSVVTYLMSRLRGDPEALVDWLTVLINASFKETIIDGSNSEERILALCEHVDEFSKLCESSIRIQKSIESILRIERNNNVTFSAPKIGAYSICTIYI